MHVAAVVDGVGAASRALEIAVEYAKERRQFDTPIGSFQAVQHLCADMLRARRARPRRRRTTRAGRATPPTPPSAHRAATMAHAFAADELYTVGAGTIQIFGGIGFTWEHDIHLYYKRLLALQETGGGTTTQLEELASIVLDWLAVALRRGSEQAGAGEGAAAGAGDADLGVARRPGGRRPRPRAARTPRAGSRSRGAGPTRAGRRWC